MMNYVICLPREPYNFSNARTNKFVLINPEVMIVCALKATISSVQNVFPINHH